jgi:ABC-type antimicrobial peptide transport system permease subunit
VDQTSLQYVLHAAVGDTITIDADTPRPIDLRIVASLSDSVLQGEVLIGEAAFRRLFPEIAGYRVFLVDTGPAGRADDVSRALEEALDPFGFDAQTTAAKLDAFHRVENTYLSTFQALGGLGLVLGCFGLVAVVARNILERRRELALLGAAGFTGRDLQRVVAVEHLLLVGAGLAIGLMAAAVAIAPVIVSRTGAAPWQALMWVVPVAVAGLAAAFGATRSLRRLRLVDSLRSE